jgi:hypothetical protein
MKRGVYCAFLLAFCLAACGDDASALPYASLGIEASDGEGRSSKVACEQLPLLQGSRRYTRHVIDDRLTLTVNAEPTQLRLDFSEDGRELAKSRVIPRGTLLRGYAEEIALRSDDGAIYTLSLASECLP